MNETWNNYDQLMVIKLISYKVRQTRNCLACRNW